MFRYLLKITKSKQSPPRHQTAAAVAAAAVLQNGAFKLVGKSARAPQYGGLMESSTARRHGRRTVAELAVDWCLVAR